MRENRTHGSMRRREAPRPVGKPARLANASCRPCARVRLHSQRARPPSAMARDRPAARNDRARGRRKLHRVGRMPISARPVHRRTRSMESVAAARRPVIDKCPRSATAAGRAGTGECSSRGSGAPVVALIPAKRDSYPKRYRHGPLVVRRGERGGPNEKELVEMTQEGPRGRDRGSPRGPSRVRRLGESPSRFLEEASGEAANRSEVATNSNTSQRCAR